MDLLGKVYVIVQLAEKSLMAQRERRHFDLRGERDQSKDFENLSGKILLFWHCILWMSQNMNHLSSTVLTADFTLNRLCVCVTRKRLQCRRSRELWEVEDDRQGDQTCGADDLCQHGPRSHVQTEVGSSDTTMPKKNVSSQVVFYYRSQFHRYVT